MLTKQRNSCNCEPNFLSVTLSILKKAEELNFRRFQLLENCLTILWNPRRPALQKLHNLAHSNAQKTRGAAASVHIQRKKEKTAAIPSHRMQGSSGINEQVGTRGTDHSVAVKRVYCQSKNSFSFPLTNMFNIKCTNRAQLGPRCTKSRCPESKIYTGISEHRRVHSPSDTCIRSFGSKI